ncbi:MAG: apolipoprotein N-acyltransferase [Phycisphaerales bacterium]
MRASSPLGRAILRPLLTGLLHAVLMAAAFPPFNLWPLAFVAPVPLVWAAVQGWPAVGPRGSRLRTVLYALRAPLLVALGVLPLWAYEQQWVVQVSALGYWPFIAVLAAFSGLFVGLMRVLIRRWPRLPLTVSVPLVWTAVEVFRGEVFFDGYPWLLVAHPLIDSPGLALPAAVLGVYFVGLLVAAISGGLSDLLFARPIRPAWAAGAAGACALVWLATPLLAPLGPAGPGPFRIAVIQTNLPQDNKLGWSPEERLEAFRHWVDLTRQAAAASPRPALIVWPETMFPGTYLDPQAVEEVRRERLVYRDIGLPMTEFHDALAGVQRELGIPMLVGAQGVDGLRIEVRDDGRVAEDQDAFFNSVFLIRGGRVEDTRYDKMQLTPFGEVMPYISAWPWLEQQLLNLGAQGMQFNLQAGSRPRTFQVQGPAGPVILGTPICFEAIMPAVCRRLARAGDPGPPRALVNLTNDGWFGNFDPAREQHLQNARWRCLELGIPMVRAANTGISAAIDARGRILTRGVEGDARGVRIPGVLLADIQPAPARTIAASVGRLFAWLILGAAAAILLWAGLTRRGGWGRRERPLPG